MFNTIRRNCGGHRITKLTRGHLQKQLKRYNATKTTTTTWNAMPRNQNPPHLTAWDCSKPIMTPTAMSPPQMDNKLMLELQQQLAQQQAEIQLLKQTAAAVSPPLTQLASPKKTTRPVRRTLLLATAAAAAWYIYSNNLIEVFSSVGFQRSMYFWRNAAPIYAHYQAIVVRLNIQQAITDILEDYDRGGSGFSTASHDKTKSRARVTADQELAASLGKLNGEMSPADSDATDHHNHVDDVIHKQQKDAALTGANKNKADIFFSHVHALADNLRVVAQDTISRDAPGGGEVEMSEMFQNIKAFTIRGAREMSQQFNNLLKEMLTTEQQETIDDLKMQYDVAMAAFLRQCIALSEPYLRKYELPRDVGVKKKHRDEQFDPLNAHYAEDVYGIIAELRGFFIKLGQLGAMRKDLLPPEWITSLKRFQSDCPYVPLPELIPLIEGELGKKIDEVFTSIEPRPLGAASIGQAHRAVLKNGRTVVIKIQYPGVEDAFRGDMATIKDFCRLAQPEMLHTLDEVEKQFMSEFCYEREAVNLFFAQHDLANSPYAEEVTIPKPVPEYCTKSVLVMELLPGRGMQDALEQNLGELAAAEGKTLDEFIQAHKNDKPPTTEELTAWRKQAKIYDMSMNTWNFLYNWTAGWFYPNKPYQHTKLPLDIRRVMHNLFGVHGYQLFSGFCLNSDPHIGNLLYLEDGHYSQNIQGGTIGLIDYGQAKATPLYFRALLAKSMIAFAEGDDLTSQMLYFFSNQRTEHNYRDYAHIYSVLGIDYDDEEFRMGMNVQAFFEYLSKQDNILKQQPQYEMPGRTSFLLRGMAHALNYPFKTHESWEPHAREFLKNHPVLDQIITAGIQEFTEAYNKREAEAKATALRQTGSCEEYFVDLTGLEVIHDWAEALGAEYEKIVGPQIFPPLPEVIGDEKKLRDKLDRLRDNRPNVYQTLRTLSPAVFLNMENPVIKKYQQVALVPEFIKNIQQEQQPHQQQHASPSVGAAIWNKFLLLVSVIVAASTISCGCRCACASTCFFVQQYVQQQNLIYFFPFLQFYYYYYSYYYS